MIRQALLAASLAAAVLGPASSRAAPANGEGRTYHGPQTVEPESVTVERGDPTATDVEHDWAALPQEFGTAADTTRAPRADEASGVADEPRPGAKALLWIPRVILFVPRYAIDFAFHPVRLGLMAYDQYELKERLLDIFFNESRTFGIYPGLLLESGFGLNGGVRLVHRNVFGHGEQLRLRGSWGQLHRQLYRLTFETGRLLPPPLALSLVAEYRSSPRDRFYGIGNADEVDPGAVDGGLDPLTADVAVATRYRTDRARWGASFAFALARHWKVELGHLWTWARFLPAESIARDEHTALVFAPGRLVGYQDGLLNSYSELAVTFDTVAPLGRHVVSGTPSSGWLITGWFGHTRGVHDDPSNYARSGADLQRFVNIFRGDRYVHLRLVFDSVHGAPANIPFTDYPVLGGPDLLRGYIRGRFRGNRIALASVAYHWPVERVIGAYVFVDAGQIWRNVADLDLARTRLGFGGGLQLFSKGTVIARLQLASSIDRTFFLQLRFEPAHEPRDRL